MHWCDGILRARVVSRPVELACPPGGLLAAFEDRDAVMLESSALHPTYGRYSILACRPLEVLSLSESLLRDGRGNVLAGPDRRSLWAELARALRRVEVTEKPDGAGYLPGWIGYVGYEVGRLIEHLPGRAPRDTQLPDLRLAFYDAVLVYDAVVRRWQLVELVFDSPPAGAGQAAEALRQIIADAHPGRTEPEPAPVEDADAAARCGAADAQPNFSPDQYRRAVARCVQYIAAGDIFQVNLSQRLTVEAAPEPMAIYRALRRRNPAWYAAYLSFETPGGRCAVLSSSPELFLRVRGDRVITRPIKGTRRRVGNKAEDDRAAAELVASPKDNAELAMIVDLLRNDLGRVCRYGSILVTEPAALEVHPTVFHLVATVEGRLCEGIGPAELLRATFPGGSITGAPKIRAMEIIDELEPVARGVYTGCIGHVGVDGSCEWNIAIRTVICDAGRAHVQVGGGIVADSLPDAEFNETLDKARALLEAIEQARVPMEAAAGK